MITLFSEQVHGTSPNSDHNIIRVESFNEVFFGVYEFEINGNKHIAEKIATYNGSPVIAAPVTMAGKTADYPFVLVEGKQAVVFNPNNKKNPKQGKGKTEKFQPVERSSKDIIKEVKIVKEEQIVEKVEIVEEVKKNVTPKFTNIGGRDIIYAENLREVFFDLFEFTVDNNQFVAEKVDSYNGNVVVKLTITENGKKVEKPFVITTDESAASYNGNKNLVENTDFNTTSDLIIEDHVKVNDEDDTIVEEFKVCHEPKFTEKEGRNIIYAENLREVYFDLYEFVVDGKQFVAEKVDTYKDNVVVKLTITEEGKQIEKPFVITTDESAALFNNNEELKENAELNVATELLVENLKIEMAAAIADRKAEHTKLVGEINSLEKAHIELHSDVQSSKTRSDKAVNKALSRLGQTDKRLSEKVEEFDLYKEEFELRIEKAEQNVKDFYNDKIRMVEESVFSNIRKAEIIDVVKESKAQIIAELNDARGLRQQVISFVKEATEDYDPVKGNKNFLKSIERRIDVKFQDEMRNIRRLMEMSSGGGTVAVQYANGGTMNGSLDIKGAILSGGVDISTLFSTGGGSGSGEVGPGTVNNFSIFTSTSGIGDSVMSQTVSSVDIASDLNVDGNSTVTGNLSVLGDFTYIDSFISTTSALSVINNGTSTALYAEQTVAGEPIAEFIDYDGSAVIIGNGGKLTANTLSSTGRVEADNISTLENKVDGLYSYLINNFDTNQITTATDLTDFVTNYPKTGLTTGDVITLSAINTAYILGDNDGSANSDWLEVNLKPNYIFYRGDITDYSTIDCVPLSSTKSSKYIMQVEDISDGAIFYGEINVVSDGTIAVATEYSLNHTTIFPFVEFGAEVVGNSICLSAVALEGKDMSNFTFKGNRSNLFG